MTTTRNLQPAADTQSRPFRLPRTSGRRRRRLRSQLRSIFVRGDFSSLLMTWALMIITALAVDAANWTRGLDALAIVSFIAVGFGFLLARSHYSEFLSLILSGTYSLVGIGGVCAYVLVDEGGPRQRVVTLAQQLNAWLTEALAGRQPPNDEVAFVVFLSVLFWYLSHNAAWHVFRIDRVWRVIVPAGLVIITNQFYYQGDRSLDGYLIAFVILSLLLLIRSHIDAREFEWYINRVNFPQHVRRTFFQVGSILAVVIVALAWIAPAGEDNRSLDRLRDLFSDERMMQLADMWNRLFSSLEGEGIATTDYYGGDRLRLSGAIQLGDQPVLSVVAPFGPRYYWRSTVFESYNAASWEWSHVRTVRAYTDGSGLELDLEPTLPGARREVSQSFEILLRASDLVYSAPQPFRMGLPVEAELDCVLDRSSQACVNNDEPTDVAIIRARSVLRRGDSYTVTSSISTATADMLRSAGTDYPSWVTDLYLQGAQDVSPRVRELAAQIVASAGAQTPYDQAKAIERWLRTNIQYNEAIPAPPEGRDPIDWFLFDEREGYCNYYASAMVMMLRAQGIPARLAAGFAQGSWDPETGSFLVRERDAHTWVEVYFPGYSWVEFEPTADEAPLDREGDETPQAVLPTVTPFPTPTPTPPPTATPDLPTEDAGANATPTSEAAQPLVPPTATPTPTPTPSPTPTPPPEMAPVDADQGGSNVLRTILITLGVFVLVIVLLVLLALFIIWYVEYRGLGGLNGIERAYARLGIYAHWLGLRLDRSATPDERRRYLVGEVPSGEKPINAITRAYIQNRYAPKDRVNLEPQQEVIKDAWEEARWAFIRRKLDRLRGRG
mgnify:FL=1|jgi:transglutaminase-like putative cysteine protease